MKSVGYCGGGLLYRLGTAEDVKSFFDCIKIIQTNKDDKIVERLYKKYIKIEELDVAKNVMKTLSIRFKEADKDNVILKISKPEKSELNFNQDNLFEIYFKFFSGFEDVVESAKYFYEDWNKYQPISIIIVDIPDCIKYKKLPIDVYEKVDGDPIWLREARGEFITEFDQSKLNL